MTTYPDLISSRSRMSSCAGAVEDASAIGTSASFVCGSFVELSLKIGDEGAIAEARFHTNGCGFMVATADLLCDWLLGKALVDLHGLDEAELWDLVRRDLGAFPPDRDQCAELTFQSLRRAMEQYRARRIEEFRGEQALICTCFGVSEDTIVNVIAENRLTDVEEVSRLCRAGSGCGSCRMLIQELIDSQ